MNQRILVPVENSECDATIIEHIAPGEAVRLRGRDQPCGDGQVARNIRRLDLRESEEMKEDLECIERLAVPLVRGMPRGAAAAR